MTKIRTNYQRWILYAGAVVIPLVYWNSNYSPIGIKYQLAFIIAALVLPLIKFQVNRAELLFPAWFLICAAVSPHTQFPALTCLAACFIVYYAAKDVGLPKLDIALSLVILGLLGWIWKSYQVSRIDFWMNTWHRATRWGLTFGQANYLGSYIAATLAYFAYKKKWWPAAACLMILIGTGNRGAYVALGASLILFSLDRKTAYPWVLAGGLLWLALLMTNQIDRWSYYRSTWEMFKDHWFLGVGPGNFQFIYQFYREALYINAGAPFMLIEHAHNFPLELLAETGIVGLATFVLLLRSVIRTSSAEAAFVVVLLLTNLFCVNIYYASSWFILALMLGVIAYGNKDRNKPSADLCSSIRLYRRPHFLPRGPAYYKQR